MLQKEAVVSEMIDMIKKWQSNSLFKDHVLVGGTALALQLGHRTSTDIDLFVQKPQNAVSLVDYFKKNYNNIAVDYAQDDFVRVFVNNIKVEMVNYEEMKLKEKNIDGIRLIDIAELAVMKLDTVLKRTEPRDFIDIAYLLKEIPLTRIFDLYKEKVGTISPLYMKRTLLVKSKNIKENEWLADGIKMIRNDIKLKDVPRFIEQAIEEFNKNVNIGNV